MVFRDTSKDSESTTSRSCMPGSTSPLRISVRKTPTTWSDALGVKTFSSVGKSTAVRHPKHFDMMPIGGSRLQHHQALLCHLADRPGWTLARVARLLDATVGHLVATEGRAVVDDDRAELERGGGRQDARQIAREQPSLQPMRVAVAARNRVVELI